MPQTFLTLLQNLPFGLLLAALLLDVFIVAKNRREVEPAVLWLLFCSICASGLVVIVTLGMFFSNGETTRLHEGFWGLIVAAVASLAWMFKRGARNRGLLTLRERFFGADSREPAKAKPGQYFWILGWRVLAVASLAAGIGHLLGIKPGFSLSKFEPQTASSAPAPAAPPSPAAPASPAPEPAPTVAITEATPPAAPTSTDVPKDVPPAAPASPGDPTKTELPTAEASAAAEKMVTGSPAAPGTVAGTPVVTPPPAAPSEITRPVSRNSAYFSKVRPIFAKACTKCHGTEKQKGDLALHSPDAIRAGINGKPAIVPGDPAKSRIYACIILPADDPDFMPQKGQPLSMSDKKTLHDWIKAGADLGDGVSIPGGGGGAFVVDAIAEGLPDPDQNVIAALTKDHIIVRPLSKNKRVLEIDFSHSDRVYSDLRLAELAPLSLHIYALDFSRTKIKDADLAHLSGMRNLSRLMLSKTEVTDAALLHLKNNVALEQLNLYNTLVTDAGMTWLEPLKALKKVYVWQTKVTEAGAKQLTAAVPGVAVSLGASEPPAPMAPKPPAP